MMTPTKTLLQRNAPDRAQALPGAHELVPDVAGDLHARTADPVGNEHPDAIDRNQDGAGLLRAVERADVHAGPASAHAARIRQGVRRLAVRDDDQDLPVLVL